MANIFSGNVIPPQPTGTDTAVSQPEWFQDFIYNLANGATNLAGSDYTQFPGPQLAAPSNQTVWARELAGANVNNWVNDLSLARDYTSQANRYTSQANDYTSQANDYTSQANRYASQEADQLPAAGALTTAGSSAISGDDIQRYMTPYNDQVVGALQQAANRNLFKNQLPQIQDRFVSAGQSRSPQEMQATNDALYQSNQALDSATAQALQSGFSGALSAASSDKSRALQGGSQLGSLAGQYGNLGAQSLAMGAQSGTLGAQSLAMGAQSGTLGAQSGTLGALTQQLAGYDVGQMAAAGQSTDATNQANINAAMNNFYSQQQWPYQNLAFASNIIRGLPVASNTQTVGLQPSSQTSYAPSPLTSFIGTTMGSQALLNGANKLRDGGTVKRKRAPKGALSMLREAA